MPETFLDRLKKLMREHGIETQYQLSKRLSEVADKPIKPNIVNNWFKGKAECPRDHPYLELLAKLFGVSMKYLRYGEDGKEPERKTITDPLLREIERFLKHYPQGRKLLESVVRFAISEAEELIERIRQNERQRQLR